MELMQTTWSRRTQWPLVGAALVFLAAYAIEVLVDPRGSSRTVCESVINVTWATFVVDHLVMLALAKQRGRWFLRHLLDLVAIALPFLRPVDRTAEGEQRIFDDGREVDPVAALDTLLEFRADA